MFQAIKNAAISVFYFYADGMGRMTLGRTLWIVALVKLSIMFLLLKPLLFPNFLKSNFSSDEERSKHVAIELTTTKT
ncbi:MAG: DUF4492 domain-containing protein [Prevotellaceae bacterium]|jgi:hypothetical protein|nr:DUF4492 domain-containing protein [Prevotellaceae bacterium]